MFSISTAALFKPKVSFVTRHHDHQPNDQNRQNRHRHYNLCNCHMQDIMILGTSLTAVFLFGLREAHLLCEEGQAVANLPYMVQ